MILANDYQQQAARTLIDVPDNEYTKDEMFRAWAALALAASSGIVINAIKKAVFHRHTLDRVAFLSDVRRLQDVIDVLRAQNYDDYDDRSFSGDQIMTLWNTLGLAGEAGECARLAGDYLEYGELSREGLIDELGDTEWYIAALCTKLNTPLSEVMEHNIAKLKRRFPDGWSTERSINREEANARVGEQATDPVDDTTTLIREPLYDPDTGQEAGHVIRMTDEYQAFLEGASEPCPVCGQPATVTHGTFVNGRPAHFWGCRACGPHTGFLCYVCPDCERVRESNRHA